MVSFYMNFSLILLWCFCQMSITTMTRKLLYNCMSIYDISYHLWNIDGQFLFKTRLFLHCIIRIRKHFSDLWSYKSYMPLGCRNLEMFCLSTGKLSEKKWHACTEPYLSCCWFYLDWSSWLIVFWFPDLMVYIYWLVWG